MKKTKSPENTNLLACYTLHVYFNSQLATRNSQLADSQARISQDRRSLSVILSKKISGSQRKVLAPLNSQMHEDTSTSRATSSIGDTVKRKCSPVLRLIATPLYMCWVIADHQIAVEKFPGPVMKTNKNKIFISNCGVEQNALQRNLSKLVSDSDFQQTCLKL